MVSRGIWLDAPFGAPLPRWELISNGVVVGKTRTLKRREEVIVHPPPRSGGGGPPVGWWRGHAE